VEVPLVDSANNFEGDTTFDLEEPQVLSSIEPNGNLDKIQYPEEIYSSNSSKDVNLNTTVQLEKATFYEDRSVSSSILSTANLNGSDAEPVPLFLPKTQFVPDFSAMEADSLEASVDLNQKENQNPFFSGYLNFNTH